MAPPRADLTGGEHGHPRGVSAAAAIRWMRVLRTFSRRNGDLLCVSLLLGIGLLSWMPRWRGPIDLRWDGAVYYVLGTSLAQGRGYRLLNEPGEIQAIQYPPLLPAIIALYQRVLATSDPVVVGLAIRRTWIVLSLAYVLLVFRLGRLFLPRRYAVFLALVTLVGYEMFFLSTLCFAELPYAFTTTLFAVLYYGSGAGRLARAGAGAAAIASYLLRTVGIALLAAWVADALLRRRFRTAALRAAIAAIPVLAWQGYIEQVQSGSRYGNPAYSYQRDPSMFYNVSYATNVSLKSPFQPWLGRASGRDLLARAVENALATPTNLGQSIAGELKVWQRFVWMPNGDRRVAFLGWRPTRFTVFVLGSIALAGIAIQLWQLQWALGLYLLLTLVALASSPWPSQAMRYFAPLVPFSLLAMLIGVRSLHRWLHRWLDALARGRSRTAGTVAMYGLSVYGVLFVLVGSALAYLPSYNEPLREATYVGRNGARYRYNLIYYSPAYASLHAAQLWLGSRAAPGATVGANMPAWTYLETGLEAVMPPFALDTAAIQRQLDSVPVSYVLLDRTGIGTQNPRLAGMMRDAKDRWRLVYSSPGEQGAEVYARIGRAALAGGAGGAGGNGK